MIGGFPQGAPAAHITPTCLQGQHGAAVGALHHRHIQRHAGAAGKGLPLQPQKVEIGAVVLQRGAAGAHNLRCQPLQFGQDRAGLEQEHAAVPGEAPRRKKLLRGGPIRLLHKPGDWYRFVGTEQRLGGFDVAVAGFWRRGHDSKRHQLAGFSCCHPRSHRGAEGGGITDHVVCRQHQQQGIFPMGGGLQRCYRHRRSGIAADRLQQDRLGLHADLAQLLGHDEAVVFIADQQRGS